MAEHETAQAQAQAQAQALFVECVGKVEGSMDVQQVRIAVKPTFLYRTARAYYTLGLAAERVDHSHVSTLFVREWMTPFFLPSSSFFFI